MIKMMKIIKMIEMIKNDSKWWMRTDYNGFKSVPIDYNECKKLQWRSRNPKAFFLNWLDAWMLVFATDCTLALTHINIVNSIYTDYQYHWHIIVSTSSFATFSQWPLRQRSRIEPGMNEIVLCNGQTLFFAWYENMPNFYVNLYLKFIM